MTPAELLADPWAFGPWCWVVDRVELFGVPMTCRGMQGLWPVEDQDERVAAALEDLIGWEGPRPRTWSALTLLQPYASAIASGHKRIENRPWRRAIPGEGLWVGLHAGAKLWIPDEQVEPYRTFRVSRDEQARHYVEHMLDEWRDPAAFGSPAAPMWPDAPTANELPLGVMLGAMHVTEILAYPVSP